jgi:hypothetical protein
MLLIRLLRQVAMSGDKIKVSCVVILFGAGFWIDHNVMEREFAPLDRFEYVIDNFKDVAIDRPDVKVQNAILDVDTTIPVTMRYEIIFETRLWRD